MGDILDDKKASSAVRLVGDDEEFAVAVTSKKEAKTTDVLYAGGLGAEIIVGITPVEGKVGAERLLDRKFVIFQALDNGIFFGPTNLVTVDSGIAIFKNQLIMIPKNSPIFFVADGANKKLRFIEEA